MKLDSNYDRELSMAASVLFTGGVIVYPTDTIWGLGCDAIQGSAIKKITQIKNRPDQKAFIILCADIEMVHEWVEHADDDLIQFSLDASEPVTFIHQGPNKIIPNLDSIAIRIPNHQFCQDLIKNLGRPIISTSANFSGSPSPKSFDEVPQDLLSQVDYVVELEQNVKCNGLPSRIIIRSEQGIAYIR